MKKKRVNSRAKGARIELEAAKMLCRLGFKAERNARNGKSTADLDLSRCPVLSRIHLEVKGDKNMDLEGAFRNKTFVQATDNANGKPVAILWKKNFRPWVLTWREGAMVLHSTEIKEAVGRLV